jgi:hypothetical protein
LKIGFCTQNQREERKKKNINASSNKNSNDANKLKTFSLISKKHLFALKSSKKLRNLTEPKRNFNVNWKTISANQRFHSRSNQYMSLQTNIYNIAFFRLFFWKWFTISFVKKKKLRSWLITHFVGNMNSLWNCAFLFGLLICENHAQHSSNIQIRRFGCTLFKRALLDSSESINSAISALNVQHYNLWFDIHR